jgi:hypothetical protein
MRAVFAILFGLLLAIGQTAQSGCGSAGAKASCCSDCACPTAANCCYGKSEGSSRTAPTREISRTVQQDFQLVLQRVTALVLQTESEPSAVFSFDSSVSTVTPIPLYERNCSYLI